MSRHVIAKEGVPSILPDTWLEKGSLWIEEGQRVPVSNNFDWSSVPLGFASDVQRNEETGEVSVEIEWFNAGADHIVDERFYSATFWADKLEERQVPATNNVPEYRLILKARVRGIAIVPVAAIPRSISQKLQGA